MARTPLFQQLIASLRGADDGQAPSASLRRRDVLRLGGAAAVLAAAPRALGGCAAPGEVGEERVDAYRASLKKVSIDVGIVGAGIAGLACAYELRRVGVRATLHEAAGRVGGRIWSDASPRWGGQVIERGGELIDTPHKTMIGYVRELGLTLEDVAKPKRDTVYRFGGRAIPESAMVEEYRVLVDGMRDELRKVGSPTAASFTPDDAAADRRTLAELLDRYAPPNIKALLEVAYTIEYGVDPGRMSSLAFLLFAKASRQSKLRLWGNASDERYHVVGGNQQVVDGLAARLAGQVQLGRRLVAVRKLADGRVELTFDQAGRTVTARHDAVVFALPVHLLAGVAFDASVGLPAWKAAALGGYVCGNNAKLMVAFTGQPWVELGSSGAAYSDLPSLQTTWETNPTGANASRAILTDYTGASLALGLSPTRAQQACDAFLRDLDVVFPGARARARRDAGGYVCHLEHWPSNPLSKGAYTANAPGYFTTVEGLLDKPVQNLYFAGEGTDSFYSWQGFMEGGALTGLRAAAQISNDF